jgi:hypothetical protein
MFSGCCGMNSGKEKEKKSKKMENPPTQPWIFPDSTTGWFKNILIWCILIATIQKNQE